MCKNYKTIPVYWDRKPTCAKTTLEKILNGNYAEICKKYTGEYTGETIIKRCEKTALQKMCYGDYTKMCKNYTGETEEM